MITPNDIAVGDWVYNPFQVDTCESIYAQISEIEKDGQHVTFLLDGFVRIEGMLADIQLIPLDDSVMKLLLDKCKKYAELGWYRYEFLDYQNNWYIRIKEYNGPIITSRRLTFVSDIQHFIMDLNLGYLVNCFNLWSCF